MRGSTTNTRFWNRAWSRALVLEPSIDGLTSRRPCVGSSRSCTTSCSQFYHHHRRLSFQRESVKLFRKPDRPLKIRERRGFASSSFSSSSDDTPILDLTRGAGATTKTTKRSRGVRDPTAKRPNQLCDPYGQGGRPLSMDQVQQLLSTISTNWTIEQHENNDENGGGELFPVAIVREFYHVDFLSGARLASKIAAVAQMNAHYPTIHLERRIERHNWQTITTVRCHTLVLGGLSTHDFHLAMLIDIEADRPGTKALWRDTEEKS